MPQYNPDFILPTLARKPDTAHPYDEEFDEGTTLDAAWGAQKSAFGSSTVSAVTMSSDVCSPYNGSSEFRVNVNPTQKPSYLRAQPPEDEFAWIWRTVTVPDNFLIYMRLSAVTDFGASSNERGGITIVLTEADSGDPSLPGIGQNSIAVSAAYQGPFTGYNTLAFVQKRTNGSAHNYLSTDRDAEGSPIEYLAMHKVGTTYHCYAGTDSNWVRIVSLTGVSYNMTHLRVSFNNANDGDINRVYGVDFIRFLETDKFPF